MKNYQESLQALRREIDELDDKIISLLIAREQVVKKVGRLKIQHDSNQHIFLKPAREAMMLRRLIEKFEGDFPAEAIADIWRNIISASTNLEGELKIAVFTPYEGRENYWLTREYFGSFANIASYQNSKQVLDELSEGKINIGIFPVPDNDINDDWWIYLPNHLKIFAHIPFIYPIKSSNNIRLFAVANIITEETGMDKSLLRISTNPTFLISKAIKMLEEQNISSRVIASHQSLKDPACQHHLIEADGYILEDGLRENIQLIGNYAIPIILTD